MFLPSCFLFSISSAFVHLRLCLPNSKTCLGPDNFSLQPHVQNLRTEQIIGSFYYVFYALNISSLSQYSIQTGGYWRSVISVTQLELIKPFFIVAFLSTFSYSYISYLIFIYLADSCIIFMNGMVFEICIVYCLLVDAKCQTN